MFCCIQLLEKYTVCKNQIGSNAVFNTFFLNKSATEVNGHHKHSQFIIECDILEKQGYKNYLLIILLE